jgi:hypothetical protein
LNATGSFLIATASTAAAEGAVASCVHAFTVELARHRCSIGQRCFAYTIGEQFLTDGGHPSF